jgi:hypothetical protein
MLANGAYEVRERGKKKSLLAFGHPICYVGSCNLKCGTRLAARIRGFLAFSIGRQSRLRAVRRSSSPSAFVLARLAVF